VLLRLEHAVAELVTDPGPGDELASRLLAVVCDALGWPAGCFWTPPATPRTPPDTPRTPPDTPHTPPDTPRARTPGEQVLRCTSSWHAPDPGRERLAAFVAASRVLVLRVGSGLPGRVWQSGKPTWVRDFRQEAAFPRAGSAARAGLAAAFCFPLVSRDGLEGVVEFFSYDVLEPAPELLATSSSLGRRIGDELRRRRIEEQVRRSEARLRAVLDAALDCIVIADADGRVLEFNPAACRTFGYTREQATGRQLAELIVPPDLREQHRAGLERYLRTRTPLSLDRRIEISGMRSDGTILPVELTITRVGIEGHPVFAGYLRDLSERHRHEEELLAARRRVVETAVAERQRLERDLHDGAQQRLIALGITLARARTALPGEPTRAAAMLDEAIRNLSDTAVDLRNLARGIHPSSLTRYGLAVALADVARRSPVDLQIGEVPAERFPAAAESTAYFVVSEALTNVARYAGTSRARVDVAVDEVDESGARRVLVVTVADDGVGGAHPGGGTGLRGLKDRLAMVDGTLEIHSPAGGGTRLHARIPLPADTPPTPPAATPAVVPAPQQPA
jgi:PAS domain S-box-containing protein